LLALLGALASCGSDDATPAAPGARAPGFAGGNHTADSVTLTEIASKNDKLSFPRDLAFNPLRPDELWIVDNGDSSMVIVHDASTDGRKSERRRDAGFSHFMPKPSSIDFGAPETTFGVPGTFATCGESRNPADNNNDFMGPALWSSDLTIFAEQNPIGLGSHLDMLHNTPLCMGIAHQEKNVYWVFGGLFEELVKYDFGRDHNVGQDDHSDGTSYFYATGQVKHVPDVPSHVFYRAEDAMLYVADTGNGRVVKLDTTSGTKGKERRPKEPMGESREMDGTNVVEVVPPGTLTNPSGLEIHEDLIYVSDNATSRITAFSLDGKQVDYLDTGLPGGALSGMAFGPDHKLYFVDTVDERVLRVDPKK
jgi:DNA-binding beta-propeller fold protein YncE